MPHPYERAFERIEDLVRRLVPGAQILRAGNEDLVVDLGDKRAFIRFGNSHLSDYQSAIENSSLPKRYVAGVENDIHFSIYQALGPESLLPADFEISSAMLNDEREWRANAALETRFEPKFAERLNSNLGALSNYLLSLLADGVDLPEVVEELRIIQELTAYYAQNKHLNLPMTPAGKLAYLKAAGILEIKMLERKRGLTPSARLREAFNNQIYDIVQLFRGEPWRDVKLPPAIHDYVAAGKQVTHIPSRVELRRQEAEKGLDELLAKVDRRLVERRVGAWTALNSENPDRLSQAANSMVEILDQVIGHVCYGSGLKAFLDRKYPSHQKTAWVENTRRWITATKGSLQATKHETNPQSEVLTEALMLCAQSVMLVILG